MSPHPSGRHLIFEPGRTALLILDMQRIWLEPRLCWNQMSWPDDHPFYIETSQRVIPNTQQLLATARRKGVEVVHVITHIADVR